MNKDFRSRPGEAAPNTFTEIRTAFGDTAVSLHISLYEISFRKLQYPKLLLFRTSSIALRQLDINTWSTNVFYVTLLLNTENSVHQIAPYVCRRCIHSYKSFRDENQLYTTDLHASCTDKVAEVFCGIYLTLNSNHRCAHLRRMVVEALL